MKKILIPTDFSISSLNVIHSVVEQFSEPVEIVLFHGVYVANSISDLLFMSKKVTSTYITNDYNDACQVLKNKYSSQIKVMKTLFFYGNSPLAFNDFVEANNVDCIIYNDQHKYKETYKYSIDTIPFIRKSKFKTLALSVDAKAKKVTEESTLSELFLSTY
ncbi:MAG: hypothetical protein JNL72_11500 [Flavipsychrobacter sp.]|nr:hypothetical protein [Flavipsychrobacter sp.]